MTDMGKLYLCDGLKECNSGDNCYKNGGMCMNTESIDHAISEPCVELSSLIEVLDKASTIRMEKLYLCDGNRDCNTSENCYKNGGVCMITTSIEHSLFNVYIDFSDTHSARRCKREPQKTHTLL